MQRLAFYLTTLVCSLSLVGCGLLQDAPESTESQPGPSGPHTSTGLALTSDALGDTDIAKMEFTVQQVDCSNGDGVGPAQTQTVDYEEMYIPGGIDKFEGEPYDQDSEHIFADSFFTVDAGCYEIKTQPLRSGGQTSQDCYAAHKEDVEVKDGKTTEILLVNQCKGPERGGLDVLGSINHPPEIGDLTFDDSKFITSCQPRTKVCVTASDPDNDPLTFEWEAAPSEKEGSLKALGDATQDDETGVWTSCAEVATTQKGDYAFDVSIFDMDGNGKKIEKVLAEQHPDDDHESRDELRFPMYGMTSCQGRSATILMAMNNDPGPQPAGYAAKLIKQTADWVTPTFSASDSDILLVLDDNNNGEHPSEDAFITGELDTIAASANAIDEPAGGLSSSDLDGYDVVWFLNPGYPMDDDASFDALKDFRDSGGGLVLQGDDLTVSSALSGGRSLSLFTNLDHIDNGVQTCGEQTNNNTGNNYEVTFKGDSISILDGLRAESFAYGDDIDHTTRQNAGETVLAEASFSSGNCTETYPAAVAVDPVDLP